MHGFFGSYGRAVEWNLTPFEGSSFIRRTHRDGAFELTQVTLPKFLNDKYFDTADGCFLSTEGVLFEAEGLQDATRRYRAGETTFWDRWRGSFAGVVYDRETDTLLLFNDHIGSKMLFYTQTEEGLVFASDLRLLVQATGLHRLDHSYAEDILEKGYSEGHHTFVKGVYRLLAGQYLCLHDATIRIHDYHRLDNTPWAYDEAHMLEETHRLFRQAVSRVITKNEQEGLQHFYPLSGGLDSRITQCTARQMTTQPITNFTFSQTGHYDHLIPKEISAFLGNNWQFLPLDGGRYITDIDGASSHTQWLVNYLLPIEIDYFAQQQDWSKAGVVLTGINGDTILAPDTDNRHELSRLYSLGFNGYSLGSPLVFQHYTESYSPFCDIDVLDYVLHIPTRKRRNYAFYDRFVLKYYPEMTQWHHKHVSIGHRPMMVTIAGRNIRLRDVPKRIVMSLLKRLHIYDAYRATKEESMNPYDYWAHEHPELTETMQRYHALHRHLIAHQTWSGPCEEKMQKGAVMEKGKVLTIESAMEHLALHAE